MSNKTAEIVNSCPESLIETKKRAERKNCEEKARTHSCAEIEQYQYHCLINELEDAFVEVCAKEYKIYFGKLSMKIMIFYVSSAIPTPICKYFSMKKHAK